MLGTWIRIWKIMQVVPELERIEQQSSLMRNRTEQKQENAQGYRIVYMDVLHQIHRKIY